MVALVVPDARAIKELLVLFGVRTPSVGPLDCRHELVSLAHFVLALGRLGLTRFLRFLVPSGF